VSRKVLAAIILALGWFAVAPSAGADDITQAHPAMWHVLAGHAQVTLFGSLHVLPAEMDWVSVDIGHAISRSDVFVFEAPTDPPSQDTLNSLITAHGKLPDGQSLRALLPPEAQADYDNAIAQAHLSPSLTDHEQPWLVSLQLTLADTMNRKYFPDAGVDYVLMSWANAHARQVRYLETIDQQFAMILPDDGDMQLDTFESGLKEYSGDNDQLQPMVQAWAAGDVAKLAALIDQEFQDHPEEKKKLITDRNKAWARKIEDMLKDDNNVFVTVGAAHLAGPDGVPALLRADGYDVDGP
jgi:uncharacterized protein YbaP (TraB family)